MKAMRVLSTWLVAVVTLCSAASAQEPTTQPATRFVVTDVWVQPKSAQVAAYQIEVTAPGAKLVGVEGGEHEAFKEPPYYDPKALQNDRVILAAFSTSAALPQGSTRVARLHWAVEGEGKPEFKAKASVIADANGAAIEATVELREGVEP
jgi:hypothetical protein